MTKEGPCQLRQGPCADAVLLHALLVGLDHLLHHLAADGTGLAGGEVAVVALLQVDAHLP